MTDEVWPPAAVEPTRASSLEHLDVFKALRTSA